MIEKLSEKEIQERKLESLLLERLEEIATPFTKADFEEIKRRGLERIRERQKRKNKPID